MIVGEGMQKGEKITTENIALLTNELIYRRYLLNKDQIQKVLRELSVPEYIVLQNLKQKQETIQIYAGKIYLKELAEKMQLPIRQTSKIIGSLRDKGLVSWSHDGAGHEGTYVEITNSGRNTLIKQENLLKDYYGKIIEKFGSDNLVQMLNLMKQLETVITAELEEMELLDNNEQFDE